MANINNNENLNKIQLRAINTYPDDGKTLHLRPSTRQLAAYLALLAVAMLFIAPLISKSMEQMNHCIATNNVTENTAMAEHSMHSHQGMLMPEGCEHSSAMNHLLMTGIGQSPMEDIACGYCQLLVHFPFLILLIAAVIRQLATLTLFLPFERRVQFWLFRPWALRLARAPPII
ncbi:DUF2946 domain-containing protein [Providencia vermicola]|uniref:DUF2946 domain-containing protein n=1 Tax=Providencia vermicola TaxID=333965 RepID=UPI0021F927E0|nr:DUF2946 domain-containing protein [Providencia stuartii]